MFLLAAPKDGANCVHLFAEMEKSDLVEGGAETAGLGKLILDVTAKTVEKLGESLDIADLHGSGFEGKG